MEGSAFLALFLVAWQWGPLPRWGRQKLLVQLHDHRPDRGGDEVREAGLVRVLAGHRVGGQLADVHRGTELEVAAVQTALPWSSTVNCQCVPAISRVAELVAVSMGSVFLPHPMHFVAPFFTQGMVQQGQIQDVGSLPRGRFGSPGPRTPSQRACQPAVPGC